MSHLSEALLSGFGSMGVHPLPPHQQSRRLKSRTLCSGRTQHSRLRANYAGDLRGLTGSKVQVSRARRYSPPCVATIQGEYLTLQHLPRRYDHKALEAYWSTRSQELNSRWGTFLQLTIPHIAKVGTSFSMGNLEREEVALAGELVGILTSLGPTFVKLGQLISSRADLISPGVAEELGKLQSDVAPFSSLAAYEVIEEELGVPLTDVFSEITPSPVAAASLAQVYKARLRSTGQLVAVKVQRPDALNTISRDLCILKRGVDYYLGTIQMVAGGTMASAADTDMAGLVEAWAAGFYDELDFELEGQRQTHFRQELLANTSRCYVPEVFQEYSSRRMLVSEWVDGVRLANCTPEDIQQLTEVGAEVFLFQLLHMASFHGDPHPGNLLQLTGADAAKGPLCLIDFGLVANIPLEDRATVACAIVHLADCNWPMLLEAFIDLKILPTNTDRP
eukprot:CAMPEP_0118954298 /NCGR_PEP_ID=MMETSP1169-20130426/58010_1 /TAXON_ID=36882 /ORGANISM="Pyramimonas obovata, Strain CCMP722" /LENGTH=448 /DNA_ID=CAMNT_0006901911 /DNA_START=102 /DNA_END=1444 /DNA_ORIENTATION=-